METRIKKHKAYRIAIFKEGSLSHEEIKQYEGKHSGSYTSTLPLQDVIDTLEEENKKNELRAEIERKRVFKLTISIIALSVVVLGLVIFAIFAFGRIN